LLEERLEGVRRGLAGAASALDVPRRAGSDGRCGVGIFAGEQRRELRCVRVGRTALEGRS
jgi:hypothetical protein